MVYVTGDTHGEVNRFDAMVSEYGLKAGDMLLVAGDFGCVFYGDERDEMKLDHLAQLPYIILFVDGNHECFPKIYSYPEETWNGGIVHRIRKNVFHLERGQIFNLEGTSVFTMGGGYSIDKMYRIPGRSWWPEEMPAEKEYEEGKINLIKAGNKVDVIVSHAAPEETMESFVQMGLFRKRFMEEARLNTYLEYVRKTVIHEHYYFGHLHMDMECFRNQTALYFDVYELKSGKKCKKSI